MKTNSLTIFVTIGLIIYSGSVFCQKSIQVKNFSDSLPEIELRENAPQKYLMVTDNQNYDIYGNFHEKTRISGEYMRGLKNDSVRWNNVRIAHSQSLDETFAEGEQQDYMENFSYVVSGEILNESYFKDIPEADLQIKTLVWDMLTFEIFAWNYWDSLKLNQEYSPMEINAVVQIEGIGSIENKDIKITWTGITKKNAKLCAVIKYQAMNNPLIFNIHNTVIQGRSHYWGNIYVSLNDKQIEYGELNEDVLMDIKMKGQETGNKVYGVRNITLKKIR